MKLILSHATGNENVRAAVNGFLNAGILTEFDTAIACFPGSLLDKLGSFSVFAELRRRSLPSGLEPYTRTWPWREIGRQLSQKGGFSSLNKHETGLFSVDAVSQSLDRRVAARLNKSILAGNKGVYAYEDTAFASFSEAKKLSLYCMYDLPIGYWRAARRLMQGEHERWPEWVSTLTGFKDSQTKLNRKDEELRLADHIFVASSFTAKTLEDYPGTLSPIHVIPYGFPTVTHARTYDNAGNRRLKLLFVGGLSQRKGIADLVAAVNAIGDHVELTIVGRKVTEDCEVLNKALIRHRWIPSLPHHEVLSIMRSHDVLVFPSLFEGFGLVITEAMAQGTPVITTERTAGPDIIEHGRNGWLIEAGSTHQLQQAIENLLVKPSLIASAGAEAMASARKRTWQVYGSELASAMINIK